MDLKELKEQNEAEEKAKLEAVVPVNDVEIEETDDDEPAKPEAWMEEETLEQTGGDPSKNVPVGKFVSLKKKLNGEISEKDKEIQRLKAQLETKEHKPSSLVRPKQDDFYTDDEYYAAKDKYDDAKIQDTLTRTRLTEQQENAQRQAQEEIDKAIDEHVDRVAVLVKDHGISAEKVELAHDNFYAAIKESFPGNQMAAKKIISMLGPGSEKVVYSHGINKVKRDHLISLAKQDNTGLKLAVYLGEQKQLLNNPTKPRSNAPEPASSVNGDVQPGSIGKFKKKYDSAKTAQEAYDIKKKAKTSGVDTSKW